MPAGIDELAAMAGLVLAIPGVIDLMIKYGAFIESKHEKYKNAKGIWSELMAYGVQLTRGNLNKMLLSARALYTEAGADPKMKDDMEIDIRRLEASLKLMTLFLENVKPKSRWGKLKFAMADEAEAKRLRKDLKEQEKDLKLKMDVIEQYKKLVPPELLLEGKRFTEYDGRGYRIDPVLSVSAGDYTEDPIGNPPYMEKTVLIEKADVNAEGTKGSLKEIAGLLHRQLSDQDGQETMPSGNFPKKGILPILGYRLTPAPQLIFQMPPGFELPANSNTRPTSLRALIAADAGTVPDHPLDFRFRLARELCEAALRVHVVHLVHKNIRPETIFLFKPAVPDAAREAAGFGDVYLTNWRLLREASGYTAKKPGSDAWAERIYRHPDRQGLQIESRYNLGHDIYSLGVCLLEIGLWDSFVIRTTASKPDGDTTTMTVAPSASFVAASEQGGFTTEADMYTAGNVKTTLLRLARGQLPARMGLGYQRLVVACLTALDKPSGFGPEVDFTTSARNDQVLDFVAVVKSYFQDLFK